jgi:lysophospholipase L1-like esterase
VCSCSTVIKKAENLSGKIPFNYPGLRLETRYLRDSDIKNRYPKIVCFGDSVTFGWNLSYEFSYPAILQEKLIKDFPFIIIINTGIGGNTIIDGLKRAKSDVISYKPDIAIINFGLNDAMINKKSKSISEDEKLFYKKDPFYYLPEINIEEFDKTYRELIKLLKNEEIKVLVMGLNPVLEIFPVGEEEGLRGKQKEIYEVYNMRIKKIAGDENTGIIDLWDIFNNKLNLEDYIQPDGLHPSEKGQYLISETVYVWLIENELLD